MELQDTNEILMSYQKKTDSGKIRENKLFEALQIKSKRHYQLQLDVQRHIHYEQLEVPRQLQLRTEE
ncbi:hypothetical protein WN943_004611 [Citrus x changshan-huyou]